MKALVLVGKDLPLDFQTVAEPVAQADELVVTLRAAALNHRDVWIQKGQYAGIRFPTILGSDGAGTLPNGKAVVINPSINWGENPRFQSPDYEILGLPRNGTFAQKIAISSEQLFPKPSHLTFSEAACLPLAGLTAFRALFGKCGAKAGEKVLISGIGGGVALFAMQFALAAGCEVWVTSSSEEKNARAKTLGATGGVLYTSENWAKNLLIQTGGVDVVIDSAGGAGFGELAKVCRAGARMAFYGGTRGAITGLSPQIIFYKQISIFGSTMGNPKEFKQMIAFVKKHKIVPIIDSTFSLENGNEAMQKMDNGTQFGKIVLEINSTQ